VWCVGPSSGVRELYEALVRGQDWRSQWTVGEVLKVQRWLQSRMYELELPSRHRTSSCREAGLPLALGSCINTPILTCRCWAGQIRKVPFPLLLECVPGTPAVLSPLGRVQGHNPQVAVYLLPVCMAPSLALLSSHAFPGQVSVSASGGSFFFFFAFLKRSL
jgi:hypothetical protein